MGLFIRQPEQRSELQNRLATELKDKLKEKTDVTSPEVEPDLIAGEQQTRPAGLIFIVLAAIVVIGGAVWIVMNL